MKVLSIIHYSDFGGPHNRIIRLKGYLEQHGISVTALLPAEGGTATGRLIDAGVEVLRCDLHRVRKTLNPLTHAAYLSAFRREVAEIERVIDQRDVDLVQIHGLLHPHGAVAARRQGVPLVWQINDKSAPLAMRCLLVPVVKHYADIVMTTGLAIARAHPGIASLGDRLLVFFPPVDVELFRPEPTKRLSARLALGLAPDDLVIGTVGHVNRFKDVTTFVRAAAIVRDSYPRARFVILGKVFDHLRDHAESVWCEAKALGLELGRDLIHFDAGTRVPELAQALDVFWLTSVSEGAPTALEEAMALELPVVATNVGAVSEIVEHGVNGLITPPRAPEEIARATWELLRNHELRNTIRSQARLTAVNRFRPEICAQAYLDAFQAATSLHRRRNGRKTAGGA